MEKALLLFGKFDVEDGLPLHYSPLTTCALKATLKKDEDGGGDQTLVALKCMNNYEEVS